MFCSVYSRRLKIIYHWCQSVFIFFQLFPILYSCNKYNMAADFKASQTDENTTTLLPSFSDRPPLSWQHAMAQHLLGFSWMAIDCISCPGVPSPVSPFKHPAFSENLQHTAVCRTIEVCLCLRLNIVMYMYWTVCLCLQQEMDFAMHHIITNASDVPRIYKCQFCLCRMQNHFILSFVMLFHFITSFFTICIICCGVLPPHAERKFWIYCQCFLICHTQSKFTIKANILFYISFL